MSYVKSRVTFSLDGTTVEYLTRRAKAKTHGNVSAVVDQLVRDAALKEAVQSEAAWYATRPGYAEDAEAERHAAGAA